MSQQVVVFVGGVAKCRQDATVGENAAKTCKNAKTAVPHFFSGREIDSLGSSMKRLLEEWLVKVRGVLCF